MLLTAATAIGDKSNSRCKYVQPLVYMSILSTLPLAFGVLLPCRLVTMASNGSGLA